MAEHKIAVRVDPIGRLTTLEAIQAASAVAPFARMFGLTEPQAALTMLMGYELGLGLVNSLNFIYVVTSQKGLRPALSSQGMVALIHRSGALTQFVITDEAADDGTPAACTVRMTRGDKFSYEYRWTLADAHRAGLLDKDNWRSYPREMLRARAISGCARVTCPDVLAGLYLADELGVTTDAAGVPVEAIEGSFTTASVPTAPSMPDAASPATDAAPSTSHAAPPPGTPPITMGNLLERWSAEEIVVANEGVIPQTQDELRAVWNKLLNAGVS